MRERLSLPLLIVCFVLIHKSLALNRHRRQTENETGITQEPAEEREPTTSHLELFHTSSEERMGVTDEVLDAWAEQQREKLNEQWAKWKILVKTNAVAGYKKAQNAFTNGLQTVGNVGEFFSNITGQGDSPESEESKECTLNADGKCTTEKHEEEEEEESGGERNSKEESSTETTETTEATEANTAKPEEEEEQVEQRSLDHPVLYDDYDSIQTKRKKRNI